MAKTVAVTIALYNSTDTNEDVYWDVPVVAREYKLSIVDTGKTNWGGQTIYDLSGEEADLEKFATEFCNAENLEEIRE